MYLIAKNFLIHLSGADPKEIDLVFVQLFFILLSFFFRHVPGGIVLIKSKVLNTTLCLRKFLAFFIGLCTYWIMLKKNEFLLVNAFFLFFYISQSFMKSEKQKFLVCFSAFILHLVSCLYVFKFYYGVYYPTHLSMITMMIVPKLMYFVWGQRSKMDHEHDIQKRSFLDLLCYIYCYPGSLIGPAMSFQEYLNFLSNKKELRYRATTSDYINNLLIIAFTAAYIILIPRLFDMRKIMTEEFAEMPKIWQFLWFVMGFTFFRFRLVFAFALAHIRSLILGISGVNPLLKSEHKLESYLKSVNFYVEESSFVFRTKINNWNISISKWLRDCFYFKFTEIFGIHKDTSSFIVFFLSSMWHGFYPSYYIGFVFFNVALLTERNFYKIKDTCPFYWLLKGIMGFTTLLISASGILFSATVWEDTKMVFKNITWVIFLVMLFFFLSKVLLNIYHPKKFKKINKEKQK